MFELIAVLIALLGITFFKADFFLKVIGLILAVPIWFALWGILFDKKKK